MTELKWTAADMLLAGNSWKLRNINFDPSKSNAENYANAKYIFVNYSPIGEPLYSYVAAGTVFKILKKAALDLNPVTIKALALVKKTNLDQYNRIMEYGQEYTGLWYNP